MLWGVLHHLRDRGSCLKRVKENYSLVFIREPIRKGCLQWLELGHALKKEEIERLAGEHFQGAQLFYCGNSAMMFYVRS